MQINKRQLKKWIAALDSGEYKYLESKFIGRHFVDFNGRFSKKWVRELDSDFTERGRISLSYLFHHRGYSFPEIATLLELVYIHKILD